MNTTVFERNKVLEKTKVKESEGVIEVMVEIEKTELVEIMNIFTELQLYTDKNLSNSLNLKEKAPDFVGDPSGGITMFAENNGKDALEISYRVNKVAEFFDKKLI